MSTEQRQVVLEVSLEEFAMLVYCPRCNASDIGGDDIEACWDETGRRHVPIHPERLESAEESLGRAREAIAEARP